MQNLVTLLLSTALVLLVVAAVVRIKVLSRLRHMATFRSFVRALLLPVRENLVAYTALTAIAVGFGTGFLVIGVAQAQADLNPGVRQLDLWGRPLFVVGVLLLAVSFIALLILISAVVTNRPKITLTLLAARTTMLSKDEVDFLASNPGVSHLTPTDAVMVPIEVRESRGIPASDVEVRLVNEDPMHPEDSDKFPVHLSYLGSGDPRYGYIPAAGRREVELLRLFRFGSGERLDRVPLNSMGTTGKTKLYVEAWSGGRKLAATSFLFGVGNYESLASGGR
jgi:hypothetical protein